MISPMGLPEANESKTYPPDCSVCIGTVVEKLVTLTYPVRRDSTDVRVVAGVPAGVCSQCGQIYLLHETMTVIDRTLTLPPEREETHPVWEYGT
jgi:YgiT-type zinc finger domain-containing protein